MVVDGLLQTLEGQGQVLPCKEWVSVQFPREGPRGGIEQDKLSQYSEVEYI